MMIMRSSLSIFCLVFAFLGTFTLQAQEVNPADSTGLPGDNFSLEGALELFKKAQSPEEFEKLLNTEDNAVNNLDLNEDGEIDYIRVVDNMDGEAHAIVLQVPVSSEESQDIAVIEIEKQGADNAILQIVGDEDIYGENVLVEPFEEEGKSTGKGGPSADYTINAVVVNVWLWPSVRYVYRPNYVVWVSPWRWASYPTWWRPWRPTPWRVHYSRTVVYRPHYRVVTTHRVVRAHKVYTPRRTSSKVVHTRTTTVVAARGKNGKAVGARTTTTTTVKGRNGQAAKRETTTRAGVKKQNGQVAAGKKETTTTRAQGQNGSVSRKQTTAAGAKKGKNGNVAAGKRKTTTVKRKRN
ncbi:MAG: hypothetical protein KDD02_24710 [Phaeodactylibacter sp.]|nr:hypothetical protein [Phaeodactylibacter sp.]MCB9299253.1 hypothetical protein [Lewinellaceae bacterium]